MQHTLILDTLKGKTTQRPPMWFMRQAGRVLPSYMALKDKYTFWQMMRDADLGAKVTLLPVYDLEVDAAILFSDILVVPYALGMGLDFTDHGPIFETPLAQINNPSETFHPDPTRLQYIYDVIDRIVATRPNNVPLIGFCGSPLTVLLYMLQGLGKNNEFPDALQYMYRNPAETRKIVDALTEMSVIYAQGQIKHGIEVFQLFETHAGIIPFELYRQLIFPAVKRIAAAVREKGIPFIYFPKGLGTGLSHVTPDMCDFVSIDWQTSLTDARKWVHPQIGLQGNIDPRLLFADRKEIEQQLQPYIEFGRRNHNWIFNLGHGFLPGISFENARFLADWVRNTDWGR